MGRFDRQMQLMILVLNLIIGVSALARSSSDSMSSQALKSFQSYSYNTSPQEQKDLFEELLGTTGSALNYPAFPRVWHQIERSTSNETDISAGLKAQLGFGLGPINLGNFGAGTKINFNYSYLQKTTLVVITSVRQRLATTKFSKVSDDPLQDIDQITVINPDTNQRHYNARPEYPMVGFCAFEMSLKLAQGSEGQIITPVFDYKGAVSNVQSESITLYSNFFQIDPEVPVNDYIDVRCNDIFVKEARPFVERDFAKAATDYVTTYHPSNQCRVGGKSSDDGDETCFSYFRQHIKTNGVSKLVPRCTQQTDGSTRCVLKARKGVGCPMYVGRNGQYTDEFRLFHHATWPYRGFACEKNLKCEMDKDPVYLGPFQMWPGVATCH